MKRMKKRVQRILQRLIGLERYLYLLALVKISIYKINVRERDFRLFLSMIPEDGVVLDIGANIGVMTVLLARRCREGKVFSFEPIPENYSVLTNVCRTFRLDNVSLHQLALGDTTGELEMIMPEDRSVLMHGLSHAVDDSIADDHDGVKYLVKQDRLDNMQGIFNCKVTAVKIDVENFENFVLNGAIELLKKHHPLIYIELWYSERRNECMKLLCDDVGYSVKVWEDFKLAEFDPFRHKRQDFFFVWEESH